MDTPKKYGLILPKTKTAQSCSSKVQPPVPTSTSAAFNEGTSSSEEEISTDWMKRKLESSKTSKIAPKIVADSFGPLKKSVKLKMAAALAEDATVYQYDEVYDEMEAKKAAEKNRNHDEKRDRKPKYIQKLLQQSRIRERERERRLEKKVQKEREAEGDEFKDKEAFVTSAYRKKMEELDKLEADEARKAEIEEILDVKKQRDMSGFYRHLYRQTMGEERSQVEEETDRAGVEEAKEETGRIGDVHEATTRKLDQKLSKSRVYRKRHSPADISDTSSASDRSESEGDGKTEEKDVHLAATIDKEEREERRREVMRKERKKRDERKRKIEMGEDSSEDELAATAVESDSERLGNQQNNEENPGEMKSDETSDLLAKKPKKDVWKKVTVGEAFETAVQRYFLRKSSRASCWPFS